MGILNHNLTDSVSGNSFSITKENGDIVLTFSNGEYINDNFKYIEYSNRIQDLTYDSILLGGLGLGVIPQYIAENKQCSTIDIIEINSELISTIQNMDYLDSSINIIQGDIFTFTPTQTYDLILLDIWWIADESFINVARTLVTKYNPYLNTGGNIYFPLLTKAGMYQKDLDFDSQYYY